MDKYAQINLVTGVCIGVSYLAGELDAPHMVPLQPTDDVLLGDTWDGETWTRPEPEPIPEPEQDRITQLEEESAMLGLELMETQIRLEQVDDHNAWLLLELVDKGVL